MKREAAAYLIVGAMTTLISMVTYHVCCNVLGIANLIANGITWIAAVIFSYFANDWLVFIKTRGGSFQAQIKKMIRFFGARAASFLVDEAGMLLLVDIWKVNNLFAKAAMNVIIVILNYVLSKWFIFKK